MSKRTLQMPKFKSESEEADWWASPVGRAYVKRKSAEAQSKGAKVGGSRLVAKLNKKSAQIAIRLPEADRTNLSVIKNLESFNGKSRFQTDRHSRYVSCEVQRNV